MEDSSDTERKNDNDIANNLSSLTSTSTNLNLPSNRFALELEFLQCLASPAYLHYLATTGLLSDAKFITFLKYLQSYWTKPEYARFVTYPHAFYFLDQCITNENFRREMANVGFRNFVHEQQFYAWQYRSKHLYGTGLLDDAGNKQNNNNANQNAASTNATSSNEAVTTDTHASSTKEKDGTTSKADQSSDEDSDSGGNASDHDDDENEDDDDDPQTSSF